MHVLSIAIDERGRRVLTVESGQLEAGSPACGVLAGSHGRYEQTLHDAHDDTTVSALARHLGLDWHTCWSAVEVEAKAESPTRRGWRM